MKGDIEDCLKFSPPPQEHQRTLDGKIYQFEKMLSITDQIASRRVS